MLITGPSGTGKNYIAPLGTNPCLAGFKVLYLCMAKLLENLLLARIDGLIAHYFERLVALDLLIIDDFGMKKHDRQTLLDFMGPSRAGMRNARPSSSASFQSETGT